MLKHPVYHAFVCLGACALLSTAFAPLHAETAYSTPCGYIQTELYGKATSYLGQGVHPEALIQHILTEKPCSASNGNVTISNGNVTITDTAVDFSKVMKDTAAAYVLVLHFGEEALTIPLNRDGWKGSPSVCWNNTSITIKDRLLADFASSSAPNFYIIRKARTVTDILGASNQFELASGVAARSDSVSIFSSASTRQEIYFNGTQWTRKGSRTDVGGMPVFGHEPLGITRRKAGGPINAFVIGEISVKARKLLLSSENTLLHMGVPLPHTLGNSGLGDAPNNISAVYAPVGDNNTMVKCILEKGAWKREDNNAPVSNTPLQGCLMILSDATPEYVTVSFPKNL